MSNKVILKYVGTGSLIEIPARDLTEQDLDNVKWTGWTKERLLQETKLYALPETLEKEQVLEEAYEAIIDKETENENKVIEKHVTKKRGK